MIQRFSIIKRAPIRVSIGLVLLIIAVYLFFSNAQYSEEFTGGVNMGISKKLDKNSIKSSIDNYLQGLGYTNAKASIETLNDQTRIKINIKASSDEKVAEFSKGLQNLLITDKFISNPSEIIEQSIIGPSVGDYMQKTAKKAVIIGLIFMAIYMMFSFAGIRTVISPAILAAITILTMFFDIGIPAGAFGIWMHINPTIQIDSVFIIAILTTMGYSINDTIIIFDRIRENIQKTTGKKDIFYGKIFEDSLRQTMRRSFGTVLCILLVIIAMYLFGSGVIQNFAFTIGIGVLAGSYSSIFISAPLAYLMMGKYKKEKNKL